MNNFKRRKLRNLLINKSFQGRVVLIVLLFGFLGVAINGVLFYWYVQNNYLLILSAVETPFPAEALFQDLKQFGLILAVLSMLVTCIIGFYLLILTHRAAGAAYHLHRVINEIKSGNTDARVYLREKDEFKELAQSFNEMIDAMQNK